MLMSFSRAAFAKECLCYKMPRWFLQDLHPAESSKIHQASSQIFFEPLSPDPTGSIPSVDAGCTNHIDTLCIGLRRLCNGLLEPHQNDSKIASKCNSCSHPSNTIQANLCKFTFPYSSNQFGKGPGTQIQSQAHWLWQGIWAAAALELVAEVLQGLHKPNLIELDFVATCKSCLQSGEHSQTCWKKTSSNREGKNENELWTSCALRIY